MESNISNIQRTVLSMLSILLDADKPYVQQWQDSPTTQNTNVTNVANADISQIVSNIDKIKNDLISISKEEKDLSVRESVLSGQLNSTTKTILKIFEVLQPELVNFIQIIQERKAIDAQYKTLSERKIELQNDLIVDLEDSKKIKTEIILKKEQ